MKLRAGIIGSSGGSALIASISCLERSGHLLEPVIIVDRHCGMEQWAKEKGCVLACIEYKDAVEFSTQANAIFSEMGCDDVLIYYTRRIENPLINSRRVWNIHPSLLPSFPGLHAVERALIDNVPLFGATLHRVDEGLDTGPILSQVVSAIPVGISYDRAHRLSYMHKVWLTLNWFEYVCSFELAGPSWIDGLGLASADLRDPGLRQQCLDWLKIVEQESGVV